MMISSNDVSGISNFDFARLNESTNKVDVAKVVNQGKVAASQQFELRSSSRFRPLYAADGSFAGTGVYTAAGEVHGYNSTGAPPAETGDEGGDPNGGDKDGKRDNLDITA